MIIHAVPGTKYFSLSRIFSPTPLERWLIPRDSTNVWYKRAFIHFSQFFSDGKQKINILILDSTPVYIQMDITTHYTQSHNHFPIPLYVTFDSSKFIRPCNLWLRCRTYLEDLKSWTYKKGYASSKSGWRFANYGTLIGKVGTRKKRVHEETKSKRFDCEGSGRLTNVRGHWKARLHLLAGLSRTQR